MKTCDGPTHSNSAIHGHVYKHSLENHKCGNMLIVNNYVPESFFLKIAYIKVAVEQSLSCLCFFALLHLRNSATHIVKVAVYTFWSSSSHR